MLKQDLILHHRTQLDTTPEVMSKALRVPLDQYMRWESGEEDTPDVAIFAAECIPRSLIRYLQRYPDGELEPETRHKRLRGHALRSRDREIFRLRSEGVRQIDIARRMGLTSQRVWQILNHP